ncbi:MAG TPA: PUA domain-containing protein [Nitrososphaera sp.]|nr:PUA domain-containing protein [Nitrososphaera sp.]
MNISVRSKRDTSDLLEVIHSKWPNHVVPKIKTFKAYEVEQGRFILESEDMLAVQVDEKIILPFLGLPRILEYFPAVYVDMGAVKFVCNGAKVMRPGITKFDHFTKGDIVIVKDQIHAKPLSVGIAMEDSDAAITKTKGYVIDNLHYVSDKFWEAYKEITGSKGFLS